MGPGGVLEAAIASGVVPVVDLRQIFRQAQESAIVTSAHAVNTGEFPPLQPVPVEVPRCVSTESPPSDTYQLAFLITCPSHRPFPLMLTDHALQVWGEQLPDSDALWVRLDDDSDATAVEDAAVCTVQNLLRSGIDVASDLQVAMCLHCTRAMPGFLPFPGCCRCAGYASRRLNAEEASQVLSPMKKGPAGTRRLNRRLQGLLNPPADGKAEVPFRAWSADERGVIRVGDRVIQVCLRHVSLKHSSSVHHTHYHHCACSGISIEDSAHCLSLRTFICHMQIANNYDKDVFNGDQGFVRCISSASPASLTVAFPSSVGAGEEAHERLVQYEGRQVDELDLAWATTVHKAQGGEAKGVLLALAAAHRPLLSRRLVYTGASAVQSQAS